MLFTLTNMPRKTPKVIAIMLGGILSAIMVAFMIREKSRSLPDSQPLPDKSSSSPPQVLEPETEVLPRYAGSRTCRECHEAAYQTWVNSNHGLAERHYRQELDQEGFRPKQTLRQGIDESEMFLDANGVAKILTRWLDHQKPVFPVIRVIGNHPLRQFLIPAPGGRLQACDVSYDPTIKAWFDVAGDEERLPGEWGHSSGRGMNWNSMCAGCHNTRLRKNYDPSKDRYDTSMAELSVSCEACHGPLREHVEWQKKYPPGVREGAVDPFVRRQSRDQMLDTCGACHSRRSEITGDLIPGDSFSDHFRLTVPDASDTYYPDGQVRDENYEYASFLTSRMHQAGIRCTDCHEPHSGRRLIPGNLLCMRCHGGGTTPPATAIDPLTHGHHLQGSIGNDCVSCHMPVTTYMQRHPRHDHGFTIPDPLLTKEHGVPNACNRCHSDQNPDWALSHVDAWYGNKMGRSTRTRAFTIARARRGDSNACLELISLLRTEPIRAWQATYCHLLERWCLEPDVSNALVEQLHNPSPLVREAAVRSLMTPARQKQKTVISALSMLLEDPARSVRVAVAWALADSIDLSSRAGRELSHMLALHSDQPIGRMQLSQFHLLLGDAKTAVRDIRLAIQWDPNSAPFHHDLAILLSTIGDAVGTIHALGEAIRLDPLNPDYHFKLGLACNEAGEFDRSVSSLRRSVELEPKHARAWYNLGLALDKMNQTEQAIDAFLTGEKADPADPDIPYARATVLARVLDTRSAIEAATRALTLRPDFTEAKSLLQALSNE